MIGTIRVEQALDRTRRLTGQEYPEMIYLGIPGSRIGRRIKHSCPNCGKIEYLRPYDIKRKAYCSKQCSSQAQSRETLAKRIVQNCHICGKEMALVPSETKRKYCSVECWKLADRSKPNTDKRRFRCSHYWARIAKERKSDFGNICPITLKSGQLQVHHIDFDYTNNEPENLIPLWAPYHRLIGARAEVSHFREALDRAVLLSITEAWK